MWAIFDLVDSKGLRFSSAVWVACRMLPSGKITRGPCEIFILLLHGVSNLIYLCVVRVSAVPYVGLLFVGFPLQFLQLLLVCLIYYSTLVKLLFINLSLLLSIVLVPNRHALSDMPLVLPPILFKDIAVSMWPSDLLRH